MSPLYQRAKPETSGAIILGNQAAAQVFHTGRDARGNLSSGNRLQSAGIGWLPGAYTRKVVAL